MAEFVSDCEGGAESVVLHDGTGRSAVAHGSQFGQAQRVALLHVWIAAYVLSASTINRPSVGASEFQTWEAQLEFRLATATLIINQQPRWFLISKTTSSIDPK